MTVRRLLGLWVLGLATFLSPTMVRAEEAPPAHARGSAPSIEDLLRQIGEQGPDSATGRMARHTLAELTPETTTEVHLLFERIAAVAPPDRQHLIFALLRATNPTVAPIVRHVLEGPADEDVRGTATWVLSQVGDNADRQVLWEQYQQLSPGARGAAVLGLARLGAEERLPAILDDVENGDVPAFTVAKYGRATVNSVVARIHSKTWDPPAALEKKLRLVGILGKITAADAVPALLKILGDDDSDLRAAATQALANIGDQTACAAAVALLNDSDFRVRYHAIALLKRAKYSAGAAAVLQCLEKDPSPSVRANAIQCLGALRATNAIPAIRRAAQDPDLRPVAEEVLRVLGGQ